MIIDFLKKTGIDIWDEMLYLILFNFIWVIGTALIIPWPFVTFGLFYIAHDVGQAKGIHFGDFFAYGRKMWREAYIWGGINLGVLIVFWFNIQFYAAIQARWAFYLQMAFTGLTFFWFFLQLMALPMYPRLIEPSFRLATRNAFIATGRYPSLALTMMVLIMLVAVLSLFFPVIPLVLSFAVIAIAANRAVDLIIKRDSKEPEEEEI